MIKPNKSKPKAASLILFPILIPAIALAGLIWWKHSNRLTFQEFKPTTPKNLTVSSAKVVVKTAQAHRGIRLSKQLVLELGPYATLTEEDNSVHSPYSLNCDGRLRPYCYLLTDNQNRTIVVEPQIEAVNLPPTGQQIEAVIGRTHLMLNYQSNDLLPDSVLKDFINGLKPYNFSDIPVEQEKG